ncbi:MAG: hypothetical protein HZB55_09540 [Deltaproteobacteria bacterium]|nr:hypothetical protein [Deltaproteobacteria bacterium]
MAINVSEYQHTLAMELRPLIGQLQEAFVRRPVPPDWEVPATEIEGLWVRTGMWMSDALHALTMSLPALFRDPGLSGTAAPATARARVASVSKDVETLIVVFHGLWAWRFPRELSDGQPVMSAVVERPLRDILEVLEKVVAAIERPEEALAKCGSDRIEFNLTLGSTEEIAAFSRWAERLGSPFRRSLPAPRGKDGCSWTSLAIAFALGYWIGD